MLDEKHFERQRKRKREQVRERARTYREKHKEELRKVRRVATKLLALRSTVDTWREMEARRTGRKIEALADTLLEFLTPEEATALSKALVNKRLKRRAAKAVKP